ncbi:MAG: hypothetical protein JWP95_533 [Actinotalea sp.]|nr:hypothetical protein [Actinotalea sp.]
MVVVRAQARTVGRRVTVALGALLLTLGPVPGSSSARPVAADTRPDITIDSSDLYVLPDEYVEADLAVQVAPPRGCGVFGGRCTAHISWTCLWRDGALERLRFADRTLRSSGPTLSYWTNDWHVRGCASADAVTPIATVTVHTAVGWMSRSAAIRFDDVALDRYARRLTQLVRSGVTWSQVCDGLGRGSRAARACRSVIDARETERRPWEVIAAVLGAGGTVEHLDALLAPPRALAAGVAPRTTA